MSGSAAIPGFALITLGAAVMILCAVDFVLRGRGTPAPYDPTRSLVSGRLYSRVRNPMYLGGVLILLGETLAWRFTWLLVYSVAIFALWHLAVVYLEEPGLHRRFGAEYATYLDRVPRWVPRLRR